MRPTYEDYPEEYCLFCCHFHDAGVLCHVETHIGDLIPDCCGCASTLEERVRALTKTPAC